MRVVQVLTILIVPLFGSCQYLKDRGIDFLDPYRIDVGAGTAVGVRWRNLGLIDTGLMFGLKPKASALGWHYGSPLFFDQKDLRLTVEQAEIIKTTSAYNLDITDGSYFSGRNSFALLPAVFSWVDSSPTDYRWDVPEEGNEFDDWNYIWSADAWNQTRYEQIHAFDVDGGLALFVYIDGGWSPGEAVDFFLGLFLIDIAADDGRF